jgi:dienelactone hydrolase
MQGDILFPTSSPVDLDPLLPAGDGGPVTTGRGILELPRDGLPPFPLLVVLPGSGGDWASHRSRYAALLSSWGIASFYVDYYSPRGATGPMPYDLKVTLVSEFDLVADAYGALRRLRRHPDIDASRVGLLGFSYGGTAARLALDRRFKDKLAPAAVPFALHVDFYGPCNISPGVKVTTGAPLLSLHGGEDPLTDPVHCARRHRELVDAGSEVERHTLPGAGHAWDAPVPARFRPAAQYLGNCELVYDEVGVARINDEEGTVITDPARLASRHDRLAARAASWSLFDECLEEGYLHGQDLAASLRSQDLLRGFLLKHQFLVE